MQISRRTRIGSIVLCLIIATGIAVFLVRLFRPLAAVSLVYSRQTTYLIEPRLPDGRIDYCEALDDRLRQGVTPENNAAPLLLKAFGLEFLSLETRKEVLEQLEVSPPEKDDYFVDWDMFNKPSQVEERLLKTQIERAQKAPWSPKEAPRVAKWLEVMEEPLGCIVEASRKTRLYLPLVVSSEFPELLGALDPRPANVIRGASQALLCRALLSYQQGNSNAAREDLIAIFRLAGLVSQNKTVIGCMTGRGLQIYVVKLLADMASKRRISPMHIEKLFQELKALAPLPPLTDILEIERLVALDSALYILFHAQTSQNAQEILGRLPSTSLGFDPNLVLKEINLPYDIMEKSVRGKTFHDGRQRVSRYTRERTRTLEHEANRLNTKIGRLKLMLSSSLRRREIMSRLVGQLILGSSLGAFEHMMDAEGTRIVWGRLCETALALMVYRTQNDRYPNSLEELYPNYLSCVLIDAFSGKPLVYRREGDGCILYSVGNDGEDGGGISETDDDDSPFVDIVIRGE